MNEIIGNLIRNQDLETLKMILFLMSKMEYSSKKKFNTKDYIKVLNENGVVIPRGFNPMS